MCAAALLILAPGAAAAGTAPDASQRAYRDALTTARAALTGSAPLSPRAANALATLKRDAPGEVDAIRALNAQPPRVAEAVAYLDADTAALDRIANDPDPAASQASLQKILAESRYHSDQGPLAFLARLLSQFLGWLGQPGAGLVKLLLLLLVLGIVALAVALLVPALRSPLVRRRNAGGRAAAGEETLPQYFRDADNLAARGDYAGAVRALAAGTMELVTGVRSYRASPLTVRETFNRSGAVPTLRPLLLAFERSYYGHHEATRDDYAVAASAAHSYRDMRAQMRPAA